MKIRDLNINDYVIVYDLGKSEHSEGMTVVGKVTELEYKDIDENEATIESVPFNKYTITDDNYFDLWSNYIESKTESVNKVGIKDLNAGDTIQIRNGLMPLEGKVVSISDLLALVKIPTGHRFISDKTDFKIIRKARKPLDYVKCMEKNIEDSQKYIDEIKSNDLQQRKRNLGFENVKIPNSNKTVRWKDNENLEVQSSYELDIPDYILQDEKSDVIGYLNKQIKCKENNDFIEEIVKNYNPIVAYYVGKSIDNLRENEIDNARDLLNKAFKHWE